MTVARKSPRDVVSVRERDTERTGLPMLLKNTTAIFFRRGLPLRFFLRVNAQPNGCWVWGKALCSAGYGNFRFGSHNVLAHRLAYAAFVEPILEGLVSDHLCRNTACVNPLHIEAVSQSENIWRGDLWNRRKTHCKSGHPYGDANTYYRTDGGRDCRVCARINWRSWYARSKPVA